MMESLVARSPVRVMALLAMSLGFGGGLIPPAAAVDLAGIVVTPHEPTIAAEMRYGKRRGPTDGARVQVLLRHDGSDDLQLAPGMAITVGGTAPDKLVAGGQWAWHDFPSEWPDEPLTLPHGGLTVLAFNAVGGGWGIGTVADLEIPGQPPVPLAIEPPDAWVSAVTFLRRGAAEGMESVHPDTLIVHVENASDDAWTLDGVRLWTPRPGESHRMLQAGPWLATWKAFQGRATIAPRDAGGLVVPVTNLPLAAAAVEIPFGREGGRRPHAGCPCHPRGAGAVSRGDPWHDAKPTSPVAKKPDGKGDRHSSELSKRKPR